MNDSGLKDVHWHGNALDVVRGFPSSVRLAIGSELCLLQLGEKPIHCKPMTTVGRGVWEIRVSGRDGAFRIFYIAKRKGRIHVLHAFQKKTRKTSKANIDIGKLRFKNMLRKI